MIIIYFLNITVRNAALIFENYFVIILPIASRQVASSRLGGSFVSSRWLLRA